MTNITQVKDNSIKALLQRDDVKARFAEMLGKKANSFLTSVLTAVQSNGKLAAAEPTSIMLAAATAASLDLPVNPNLGFAYLIPYDVRQQDGSKRMLCQFQIGYKGFIQLCQRTGMFKSINAVPVYEGQLREVDPLKGNTYDWNAKQSDKVIGYVARFELTNGYSHELYMTSQQVSNHAGRYSKTYKSKSGVWFTNEIEMSIKTVLKLLLSRYAPLSTEYLHKAINVDQAVIKNFEGTDVEYVDNAIEVRPDHDQISADKETERIQRYLSDLTSVEELELLNNTIQDNHPQRDLYLSLIEERKKELSK